MPERIQRKRTAGWRLPRGAVIVDRTAQGGNPWTVAGAIEAEFVATEAEGRRLCTAQHRRWLDGEGQDVVQSGKRQFDRRIVLAEISVLSGRDLACPCGPPAPGQPDYCHARNLMDQANAPGGTRHPSGCRKVASGSPCSGAATAAASSSATSPHTRSRLRSTVRHCRTSGQSARSARPKPRSPPPRPAS